MPNDSNNSPARSFAPGTFEQTRRNIGPLDPQEALEMQKKLGGEILPERSAPIDPSTLPKSRSSRIVVGGKVRTSGMTSSDATAKAAANSSSSSSDSVAKVRKTDADLPALSARNLKLMNRLMQSDEYAIKPDYGFLNFLFSSGKNKEKVTRKFGSYTLKRHVDHLQAFITTVKTFIQVSPATYKAKIATEPDLKFKFLRTVGKWTLRDIKVMLLQIEEQSSELTIPMLIPITREIYKEVITIYYIGEQKISDTIKEIFTDICEYPKIDKKKLETLAKQGVTEWIYVYDQIIKGMYPLLMRMCSTEYVEFPKFFTQQLTQILNFLGISKFDLLAPEKRKKISEEKKSDEEKKPEEDVKEEEKKKEEDIPGKRDEIVEAGLKILDQLFPDSGFNRLESHPDMYPYFQPLYKFDDGFNMLSQDNGIQVTLVLIKILEDLFHGCRNIEFNIKADEKLGALPDSITNVMSDWSYYYEDCFNKNYGEDLRSFMNTLYTQSDYASTNYGKELINKMYWACKFYFLPHLKFNAPTLTKPRADNKYSPLYNRTNYVRRVFTVLAGRIDENSAEKKPVLGVLNPWNRYNFEIPNVISKRLDVLLGAKHDDATTAATNANLIKYTLCIIAVLDWWINNKTSPAYSSDASKFYRSSKDGSPDFSAKERTDQNQLFAESVKKAIAARKGQ